MASLLARPFKLLRPSALGVARLTRSLRTSSGSNLQAKTSDKKTESSHVFDYDTFFQNEVDMRLSRGMYDFFLPLHHMAGSEQPHMAQAALNMYKTTPEVIPLLDAIEGQTGSPEELERALSTMLEGLPEICIFATTDYLGLSTHPKLIEIANKFTKKHGISCTGSRYITGNSLYQQLLERECARMHNKDAAVLFLSCFDANNALISTLGSWLPNCLIYSDEGNHASIVEGVQRSGAEKRVYKHNDPEHLEELMAEDLKKEGGKPRPKLVLFESIYSMTGDVCPIKEVCDVAHKYGALTFVDEAHGLGMYGDHGRGLSEEVDCCDDLDIIASTLGKGVGFQGGYIAGNIKMTEAVRHRARGFVFTSTLTPGTAAAGLMALRIVQSSEGKELRRRLHDNVQYLRTRLTEEGIPTIPNRTHIIPVKVHHNEKVHKLSRGLLHDYHIYVPAVRPPAVPKGQELIRVIPQPNHTRAQLDHLVNSIVVLWKKLELPFGK